MKKFFIVLLVLILINPIYIYADEIDNEQISQNELLEEINLVQASGEVDKAPSINSRHAVVYDRSNGVTLYGKKENEKCKMASTTKIMTCTVVLEKAKLTDVVEVSKKAAGTGGSRLGLKAKDKITVHDLLYGLMLCSGNDAAVALAEYVGGDVQSFADLMNEKAKELKLENTNFVTPHGLDEEEHYTTAYELAKITEYALNIPKFTQIVGTKNYTVTINGNAKNINNTNELLGNFNGVYGVKTGFTNGANRCLVTSIKRGDLDLICVVLGADTKRLRTQDSIKLIEYVYSNYEMLNIKEIIENSQEWKEIQSIGIVIEKGIKQKLELELEELKIEKFPILKEKLKDINIEMNLLNTVNAPVKYKQIVGTVQIKIGDELIRSVDILSKEEVDKKVMLDYLKMFLNVCSGEQCSPLQKRNFFY